jgi:hypothetical protein
MAPLLVEEANTELRCWSEVKPIAIYLAPRHRFHNDVFQHSELLKITTSADHGHKGVSCIPERKNPGSAFWVHQPGFSCDPREVPGCSGNLPEMSFGGYVIPFRFQLISGR